MEIIFTPYDPANWTQCVRLASSPCAWHGQIGERQSDKCSVDLVWTMQTPDGRKFAACENAAHDALRHYAKQMRH